VSICISIGTVWINRADTGGLKADVDYALKVISIYILIHYLCTHENIIIYLMIVIYQAYVFISVQLIDLYVYMYKHIHIYLYIQIYIVYIHMYMCILLYEYVNINIYIESRIKLYRYTYAEYICTIYTHT
jgi:hypothetical protein